MPNPTLHELQVNLLWGGPYSEAFGESMVLHKDFGHALTHSVKALGQLALLIEAEDHGVPLLQETEVKKFIADLVICAARMANTLPHGSRFDLEQAVVNRIESKNGVRWVDGRWVKQKVHPRE